MKRIYKTIISAFILTILMMLTLPVYSKADIIIDPISDDLYYWPEINDFKKIKDPQQIYVVCSVDDGIKNLDINYTYYIPIGYCFNYEINGSDIDTTLYAYELEDYIKKYGGTSENSIPIFVEMTSAKEAQNQLKHHFKILKESPFTTTGSMILIILMVIIAVETSILILIKIKKKSTQQVDNIQSVNNKEE